MRILITGGTGLIGTALADSLLQDGHEVILLSRNPARTRSLAPKGAQLEAWDGKTANGWGKLINNQSVIVNLAGSNLGAGRWTASRKKEILDSRLFAGQAVVQAVQQAAEKPLAVLQSSAVGYYGSQADKQLTEGSPAGSDFASRVTVEWEKSTAAVEALGVRRVILRTGVVISTRGGAFPKLLLPFRLFVGGPIGSGKQWFPWIHLADEVAGIRFLIDHPETSGLYNLSAPNPVQNKTLARAIGKALHRPALLPVPPQALQLLFGEMSTILLASQRVLPQRLVQAGMKFQFPEIEPALKDLFR
jgi:hypothetical protein